MAWSADGARFVVIGNGSEQAPVQELARELDVLDRNLFMLEAFRREKLPDGWRPLTWHWRSSRVRGLYGRTRYRTSIFDALAAGKPVACNFDGGQTSLAVEADIGLMLDPADLKRAAVQLFSVLHDSAWLDGVPSRARVLAEGRSNRDNLADELKRVLWKRSTKDADHPTDRPPCSP